MGHVNDITFKRYWLVSMVLALAVAYSAPAQTSPPKRKPDSSPTSYLEYCLVYARDYGYSEYSNRYKVAHPSLTDLELRRNVSKPLALGLNQKQCSDFQDKDRSDEFFFSRSSDHAWYRRSEFIHESELVPIDRWTTRYIYNNSYLSHVGSELTSRAQEERLDLYNSYANYSLPNLREGLIQFSDDGYFTYADDGGGRWRIMRHPNRPPDPANNKLNLYAIDESGQYLPRGVWAPSVGSRFRYSCSIYENDKYSCGFGPRHGDRLTGVYFYGPINRFAPIFTPLKIEVDRITIARRVSRGEPFQRQEREDAFQKTLFFYADFDDPIRPVYFAPGLLLKDPEKLSLARPPRKPDFVQYEVCLTDCPDDISWQYGSQRRRNEAHP